jgi:lipoate-protein ligase B
MSSELLAVWLGRRAFALALEDQLAARERLVAERGPPTLFLVEHPPVLTLGRRARPSDVLWGAERLAAEGIEVCESPRGGEVTLHAPGQLVAYPVVHVGRKVREHVERMAQTSVEVLAELGLAGARYDPDHPGVWLGPDKLGSIGIHVSRGVAVQGLSLNLDVDPSLFSALVSCGLRGVDVTSARRILGAPPPPIERVAVRWAEVFARRAGLALRWRAHPLPIC